MTRLIARLPHLFLIGAFAVALLIARNWAYVTTYRTYLNQRVDEASRSAAAQRFDIEGTHVVPQIAMRDDDRVSFTTALGRPSTFRVQVRPVERAHYEIRWHDAVGDRVLSQGDVTAPANVTGAIPPGGGRIELIGHGSLTWIDPRFERDFRVAPHLLPACGAAGRSVPEHASPARTVPARRTRSNRLVRAVRARRQRRDHARPARRRSSRDGRSHSGRDRGPAARPRRSAVGSEVGRFAPLRPAPSSPNRRRQRMAPGRHRPHGIHSAGGRRRPAAPVRVSNRRRRVSQRARARPDRCRRARRFIHGRDDGSDRKRLGHPARAADRSRGSELRDGGIRPAAGTARAEGLRRPPSSAGGGARLLRRERPVRRRSVRRLRSIGRRDPPAGAGLADQGRREPVRYLVRGERGAGGGDVDVHTRTRGGADDSHAARGSGARTARWRRHRPCRPSIAACSRCR